MLLAIGVGGVTLMVSEQGPMTIGRALSLTSHIVAHKCIDNDGIYASFSVQM